MKYSPFKHIAGYLYYIFMTHGRNRMTKDEITELALRYIENSEIIDFPEKNDLFCFLLRDLPTNRILAEEEGWNFGGYALCTGYEKDHETKPPGKWIWFNYLSLNTFPPKQEVTKLQPPHIAKGFYSSPDRETQIRIVKIMPETLFSKPTLHEKNEIKEKSTDNIIKFPGKQK